MIARPPAESRHREPSQRSLKWTKLHRGIWRSPELRACGAVARMLWVDLCAMCDEHGRIATPDGRRPTPEQLVAMTTLGEPSASVESALATLATWGFVVVAEHGIVVSSVEEDARYRDSRRSGGEARQGRSVKDAEHDAEHLRSIMLSTNSASPSGSSGSSSSGSGVSEVRSLNPETQSKGKVKKNNTRQRAPATGPNAEVIRAFEAEFLRVRGAKYAFGGAKDGEAVAAVLEFAGGDPAKVIERIPWLFRDSWRRERASLALLRSKWNECLPPAAPAQTTFVDSTQEPENAAFIAQLRANAARQEAEKAAKRNGAVVGGAA